jgi:hypothetical protein
MIKIKLYCNVYHKFERAIECADYLISIASLENPDKAKEYFQSANIHLNNISVTKLLSDDI